jgi:hypothetical protein
MARSVRFLIPIVVAVVLGPLIAGLAIWIFAVVLALLNPSTALPIADVFTVLYVYVLVAYILGVWIALLAGILVSIWMLSRPPSLIVVIAAAIVATAAYQGLGALGVVPAEDARSSNLLLTFALAVIAAIGCWLLMRRFAPARSDIA